MIRNLLVCLGCALGPLFFIPGAIAAGAEPVIETVGQSEYAFDYGGSRINVSIRDPVLRKKRTCCSTGLFTPRIP